MLTKERPSTSFDTESDRSSASRPKPKSSDTESPQYRRRPNKRQFLASNSPPTGIVVGATAADKGGCSSVVLSHSDDRSRNPVTAAGTANSLPNDNFAVGRHPRPKVGLDNGDRSC